MLTFIFLCYSHETVENIGPGCSLIHQSKNTREPDLIVFVCVSSQTVFIVRGGGNSGSGGGAVVGAVLCQLSFDRLSLLLNVF